MKAAQATLIAVERPHSAEECPVTLALDLIARKWSVHILFTLMHSNGPIRFGALQKAIGKISQRELTKHLREFETSGLLFRQVFPEVPPRVEYSLTTLGQSLIEPMTALNSWAMQYGPTITQHRAASIKKEA